MGVGPEGEEVRRRQSPQKQKDSSNTTIWTGNALSGDQADHQPEGREPPLSPRHMWPPPPPAGKGGEKRIERAQKTSWSGLSMTALRVSRNSAAWAP